MCFAECLRVDDTNFAHCGRCHETFATVEDFDKHRSNRAGRRCLTPDEHGLTKRNGIWAGAERVDLYSLLGVEVDRDLAERTRLVHESRDAAARVDLW